MGEYISHDILRQLPYHAVDTVKTVGRRVGVSARCVVKGVRIGVANIALHFDETAERRVTASTIEAIAGIQFYRLHPPSELKAHETEEEQVEPLLRRVGRTVKPATIGAGVGAASGAMLAAASIGIVEAFIKVTDTVGVNSTNFSTPILSGNQALDIIAMVASAGTIAGGVLGERRRRKPQEQVDPVTREAIRLHYLQTMGQRTSFFDK